MNLITIVDSLSKFSGKRYSTSINALKKHRTVIILFLLSLLTRWILIEIFTRQNAAEGWDALGYFIRAIGVDNAISDLLRGNLPATNDLATAYTSTWPPFQSILLGVGLLLFDSSIESARFTMVLVSAFTTPLVYLVTRGLAGHRAAIMASIVFIFYPTFLHYSVRLFSETTYIFLVFLSLYFVLKVVNHEQLNKKKTVYLVLIGVTLGVATLTRAAGVVWIPTVAIWLFWQFRNQEKRLLTIAIVVFSAGVTLLPWELALFAVEDRVAIVTTSSDFNLYLGNNPVAELGKEERILFAQAYSDKNGITLDEAYRTLAIQTIINDPVEFVQRGLKKWQNLWSIDKYFFIYMYSATFPPINNSNLMILSFIVVFSYFIYIALAVKGLLSQSSTLRYRSLIITLIVVAMLMHFITIAHTRFNVPLQAVLLPAVGLGLAHWKAMSKSILRAPTIFMLISIVLIWMTIYRYLPFSFRTLTPSSYYSEVISNIDRWIGTKITVGDRLLFRKTDDVHNINISITIANQNYEFAEISPNLFAKKDTERPTELSQKSQTYNWTPLNEKEILSVVLKSKSVNQPLKLELSSNQRGIAEELVLTKDSWQTWQSSSLPGIEYMWVAGPGIKRAAVRNILKVKGLI